MTVAVVAVAILLLIGVGLRQSLSVLRRFFIPASVIAGFVGLGAVNVADWLELRGRSASVVVAEVETNVEASPDESADGETEQPPSAETNNQAPTDDEPSRAAELAKVLSGWPGPLIAIVFAAMLLQPPASNVSDRSGAQASSGSQASRVGRQGLMVWIIVLGETFVGLLVTWLLIQPRFDLPNSFGFLIETGFAGGHGTAAAMGQVFANEKGRSWRSRFGPRVVDGDLRTGFRSDQRDRMDQCCRRVGLGAKVRVG